MHPFSLLLLIAPGAPVRNHLVDAILADLPTEPAAVAVLILLVSAVGAVVWFGRNQGPPG